LVVISIITPASDRADGLFLLTALAESNLAEPIRVWRSTEVVIRVADQVVTPQGSGADDDFTNAFSSSSETMLSFVPDHV
jgi:hypothetical protein